MNKRDQPQLIKKCMSHHGLHNVDNEKGRRSKEPVPKNVQERRHRRPGNSQKSEKIEGIEEKVHVNYVIMSRSIYGAVHQNSKREWKGDNAKYTREEMRE